MPLKEPAHQHRKPVTAASEDPVLDELVLKELVFEDVALEDLV